MAEFVVNDEDAGGRLDGLDQEGVVDEVLAEISAPPRQEPPDDYSSGEFDDVDLHVDRLMVYRNVLSFQFFDKPGPAEQKVEKEIKTFVRRRLAEMLGKVAPAAEPAPAQFTLEEVVALKATAARIIANSKIIAPPKAPPKPQQRQMPARSVTPTPSGSARGMVPAVAKPRIPAKSTGGRPRPGQAVVADGRRTMGKEELEARSMVNAAAASTQTAKNPLAALAASAEANK